MNDAELLQRLENLLLLGFLVKTENGTYNVTESGKQAAKEYRDAYVKNACEQNLVQMNYEEEYIKASEERQKEIFLIVKIMIE